MKRLALLPFLFGCIIPLSADENLAVNLKAALSTERPEEVQKTIVDWVEARGGRIIIWSRARLSVRLPREKSGELEALLKTLPCRVSGLAPWRDYSVDLVTVSRILSCFVPSWERDVTLISFFPSGK